MKMNKIVAVVIVILVAILLPVNVVLASSTSQFSQVINAGTLSVDIVDGSYVSVGSPSVTFGAVTFSFACHTNTGTLGTASQQIYVRNPDAADNGWTVSIAGSATTALWTGTGSTYDFNDPTGSGCTDGADTDTKGGQMTVDASVGTLAAGQCLNCTTNNITKGSSNAFSEGSVNSISLLTGSASSDDIGDWTFQGVSLSQKIPAEQAVASDYAISMVLSIVSN